MECLNEIGSRKAEMSSLGRIVVVQPPVARLDYQCVVVFIVITV